MRGFLQPRVRDAPERASKATFVRRKEIVKTSQSLRIKKLYNIIDY